MPRRRWLAELNREPHAARFHRLDHPLAAKPTEQTHPQAVAHLALQHLADVHRTLITQHDNIAGNPVDRMQQNDVHPFSREGLEALSRRRGERGILVQLRAWVAGPMKPAS